MSSKLRDMRKRRGVSQEELAAAIGVKKGAISKYEKGTAEPPLSRLRAIAVHLQCALVDLIEDSGVDPQAMAMLDLFHGLSQDQRDAMVRLVASMAEPTDPSGGTQHDRKKAG